MNTRRLAKHWTFYCAFLAFISHTIGFIFILAQLKQPHYLSLPGTFSFSQSLLLYDRDNIFTWKQSFEVSYPDRTLTFHDFEINQKLSTLERHLFTLGDYEGQLSRIKEPVIRYYFCELQIQKEFVPNSFSGEPISVKWILSERSSLRTIADVPCKI